MRLRSLVNSNRQTFQESKVLQSLAVKALHMALRIAIGSLLNRRFGAESMSFRQVCNGYIYTYIDRSSSFL